MYPATDLVETAERSGFSNALECDGAPRTARYEGPHRARLRGASADGLDDDDGLGHTGKGGRDAHGLPLTRSEERRVGKECRSRWSPYH